MAPAFEGAAAAGMHRKLCGSGESFVCVVPVGALRGLEGQQTASPVDSSTRKGASKHFSLVQRAACGQYKMCTLTHVNRIYTPV